MGGIKAVMAGLIVIWKYHLHDRRYDVLVKNIVISFLREKQRQLMKKYEMLEEIQREYPELYFLCQSEMDRADWNAELIRRKISELAETD